MLVFLLVLACLLILFIYCQNKFLVERHGISGGRAPGGAGRNVGYHPRAIRPEWGDVGYTSNWGNWGELPYGSSSNCSKECIQNNNCNCNCKPINGIYTCI